MDTVDVKPDNEKCKQQMQGNLVAQMPVDTAHALEYNMNHKNRGLALIFNHEIYDMPFMSRRQGTNMDSKQLQQALQRLHFDVSVLNDCTLQQMLQHVEKAAAADHSHNDCLLIAILTHGEHGGYLYAKDMTYKLDAIWHYFLANHCPTLAGKPKLFFIQACQGDQCDAGVLMQRQLQSEISETDSETYGSNSYTLPVHADFLFAYSTMPGFYSWRNPDTGSWFIQALVQELNKNAYTMDILTLLTFVNQRVALDFESYVPNSIIKHQQKQMPCVNTMLTRILRFTEKPNNNNNNTQVNQQ